MADAGQDFISYYSGFPSFFKSPIITPDDINEGMVVVAGVPLDEGINMGRKGARYGPRGIREGTYKYRTVQEVAEDRTTVDIDSNLGFRYKGDHVIGDIGDFAISPQDILQTTENVAHGVSDIVRRGGLPVVLGGDHYVCYPSFLGFARGMIERKSNPRIGYLHIDSHADFWDQLQGASRYNHGTSVRRISENSMISYKNMAWLGLNGAGMDPEQYRMYTNHSLKMLTARMMMDRGIDEAVKEVMEVAAESVDAVYVSIDIDVVDGSEAAGTTACVYQGIRAREFLYLTSVLSQFDIVKGIDICEVSPPLDPTGRTVHLAALGVLSVLSPKLFDTVDMTTGKVLEGHSGFSY